MVHCLDRQENRELLAGLVLRDREPELELARSLDHVFDDLIDRVLVDARPLSDRPTGRAANATDELRRRDVARELGRVGEEPPQIAVVEVRIVHAVICLLYTS